MKLFCLLGLHKWKKSYWFIGRYCGRCGVFKRSNDETGE